MRAFHEYLVPIDAKHQIVLVCPLDQWVVAFWSAKKFVVLSRLPLFFAPLGVVWIVEGLVAPFALVIFAGVLMRVTSGGCHFPQALP